MKKIGIDVIDLGGQSLVDGHNRDTREIKIPWAYEQNIPFKVGKSVDFLYTFNSETLSEFILNNTLDVVQIQAKELCVHGRPADPIPSVTVPMKWFKYYISLDGILLKPNKTFSKNSSWHIAMDVLFNKDTNLKAVWSSYVAEPNIRPFSLSLVQEDYLPEITYLDTPDRSNDNNNEPFIIECDWVYSVKNLPMTVVLGNNIIAGKHCFKDYKEQLLKLATELEYTNRYFDCDIQLTGNGNFSLTVILDDECNNGRITYLKATILSISDDKIKLSLLGDIPIPNQIKEEFSKNKIASFVWKTIPNESNDSISATPVGFQIMSSDDRCAKISYAELWEGM